MSTCAYRFPRKFFSPFPFRYPVEAGGSGLLDTPFSFKLEKPDTPISETTGNAVGDHKELGGLVGRQYFLFPPDD